MFFVFDFDFILLLVLVLSEAVLVLESSTVPSSTSTSTALRAEYEYDWFEYERIEYEWIGDDSWLVFCLMGADEGSAFAFATGSNVFFELGSEFRDRVFDGPRGTVG